MNTKGWRVEKSTEDDRNTESGFVADIAQAGPDGAEELCLIFADWLEDAGRAGEAADIRRMGGGEKVFVMSRFRTYYDDDSGESVGTDTLSSGVLSLSSVTSFIRERGLLDMDYAEGVAFESEPVPSHNTEYSESKQEFFIDWLSVSNRMPPLVERIFYAIINAR